jgi:hypothetical protein
MSCSWGRTFGQRGLRPCVTSRCSRASKDCAGLTLRTSEFGERAHVGQLRDHTHRMGVLIAQRDPTPASGE